MMPSKVALTPLSNLKVSKHHISAHGLIPNTSIQNRPILHYHGAFVSANASAIESHLNEMKVVTPAWRYTMYSTTHFHSTSHELLCIASGAAKCCFGGEDNPERYEPLLKTGDVILVPAGVGHRLLEEVERPFQMVGCYPPGLQWDMCYGKEGEEDKVQAIEDLAWFQKDPVYGEDGPAVQL